MTSRPARVVLAVLAAVLLTGTATAYAHTSKFEKQVEAALRDCANSQNGQLKGHYTLKVLQTALKDVKAEPLQYTNCATVLTAAIRADTLGHPRTPSNPHNDTGRVSTPTTTR